MTRAIFAFPAVGAPGHAAGSEEGLDFDLAGEEQGVGLEFHHGLGRTHFVGRRGWGLGAAATAEGEAKAGGNQEAPDRRSQRKTGR